MHLAIVSPYDPRAPEGADPLAVRGGVEEALDRAASGLAARGHEVTLVTSGPRAERLTDGDGVRIVRVKRRAVVFRNPVAAFGRAIPRSADVVHVPATYPLVSDLIPLRESADGRATVLDYHFDVHGTSRAMRAAAALHRATLARGMLRATRIVARSRDYAAASATLGRLPPERVDVVPNGVDVDAVPLGRGPRSGLLCVGRLVPYKGVDVLLRAMPRIHLDSGERLTVVGDGPERGRLEALARELDAPVEFAGRLPRDELLAAFGRARLTVLPSVNSQEAFGIALVESMAAGTPVVASDLPGVREVARLAGLAAPARDPDALAARVVEALRDPRAFGSPADIRARVRAAYGWPSVLRRLERIYAEALDAPAALVRSPAPARRTTRRAA